MSYLNVRRHTVRMLQSAARRRSSGVFPLYGTYGTYLTDGCSHRCAPIGAAREKDAIGVRVTLLPSKQILRIRDAMKHECPGWRIFFCPLDPRAHPRNAHNADPQITHLTPPPPPSRPRHQAAATQTYEQAAPSRPSSARRTRRRTATRAAAWTTRTWAAPPRRRSSPSPQKCARDRPRRRRSAPRRASGR